MQNNHKESQNDKKTTTTAQKDFKEMQTTKKYPAYTEILNDFCLKVQSKYSTMVKKMFQDESSANSKNLWTFK